MHKVQRVSEVHVRQLASHSLHDYPEGKYLKTQLKHVDDEQLTQLLWHGTHISSEKYEPIEQEQTPFIKIVVLGQVILLKTHAPFVRVKPAVQLAHLEGFAA